MYTIAQLRVLLLYFLLSVFCQPLMTVAQDDTQNAVSVRDSWPRFLGKDFDGAGIPAADLDWAAQPDFLWSLRVGHGYGLGAVHQGHYYHFDAALDGSSERLKCIDMKTGKEKWRRASPLDYRDMYGYENGPRGSATIAGDRIYTMGVGGRLTCRNLTDGAEVWHVDTTNRYGVIQNFFGAGGAPLVIDDLVIVMVGGSPAADQSIAPGRLDRVSPNGSALVAFDVSSGKQRWVGGNDLASYSSPRPMTVDGKTIVLLFARDHLLAVDPGTGKQLWAYRHRADIIESVNAMVPIVDNNHVFISECYAVGSVLLKVTLDGATEQWKDPERDRRKQAMRVHWSNPALIDGHLFGCSGRNAPDSDFRCVELMTGEVKWKDTRRTRSSVTAVGDHFLLFEERGFLQVVKANTEKMEVVAEWELQLADGKRPELNFPCWAAPIVLGDKVLVRGDEHVLCMQLKTK